MGLRRSQRSRLVLPVRISGTDIEGKPFNQTSCTLDVNRQGARLYGLRCIKGPGEVVTIQYKKNRGRFMVVWMGKAGTRQDGQVGLRNCDPDQDMWGLDLPATHVDDYVAPESSQINEISTVSATIYPSSNEGSNAVAVISR